MQIQKENIKEKIIGAAREEFFEKGFKNASMRIIAKKSKVGLSNIYNYFQNKDEILREVLSPLLLALDKIMNGHNNPKHVDMEIFISLEYQRENINMFVDLILNYKEELKLLLFKSHGSSFENFRDEYTDKHTETGVEYLKKMKEKYPHINNNISDFFTHTMSSWWLSIIGEIVSHDLDTEEIQKFIAEYMEFATAGWEKLMKI